MQIDGELISYNGKQPATGVGASADAASTPPQPGELLVVDRGVNGTTPSSHERGAVVILVCVGDCNRDGEVTIDELLKMVNIALEAAPASECPVGDSNDDGAITIDEILTAVNRALNGCVQSP